MMKNTQSSRILMISSLRQTHELDIQSHSKSWTFRLDNLRSTLAAFVPVPADQLG